MVIWSRRIQSNAASQRASNPNVKRIAFEPPDPGERRARVRLRYRPAPAITLAITPAATAPWRDDVTPTAIAPSGPTAARRHATPKTTRATRRRHAITAGY